MNFIKRYLLLSILIVADLYSAPGAGIYFVRRTPNGPEILFACDPYQQKEERRGFEHPGGAVDESSDGHLDLHNPKTFLRGGLREAFEETACTIAMLMKQKGLLRTNQKSPYVSTVVREEVKDYKTGKKRIQHRETYGINKDFIRDAVDCGVEQVRQKGLAYVYKSNIFNERSGIRDKNAVFFWDITDICGDNLPQTIVNHRMKYKQEKSHLNLAYDLHAEPVAFAWVKVKDLEGVLDKSSAQWVPVSQYAEHHPYKNYSILLEQSNLTIPFHRSDSKTKVVDAQRRRILLSDVCIKMMKDRLYDRYNQQDDTGCVHKVDGTCVTIRGNTMTRESHSSVQHSSSMRAMMRGLQQRSQDNPFS